MFTIEKFNFKVFKDQRKWKYCLSDINFIINANIFLEIMYVL